MKSVLLRMMSAIAMSTLVAPAFAEGNHPGQGHGGGHGGGHGAGIEKRIQRQKKRIEKGVEKGKLTPEQAAQLQQNVDKIEAEKTAATANGQKLTQDEKKKLQGELNESSKQIRDLKNPGKPAVPAIPAVPAQPASTPSGQ
jgi:hypothetical protein